MGGWLSVTELGLCPWENEMKYPGIYFSPGNTQTNWNHGISFSLNSFITE